MSREGSRQITRQKLNAKWKWINIQLYLVIKEMKIEADKPSVFCLLDEFGFFFNGSIQNASEVGTLTYAVYNYETFSESSLTALRLTIVKWIDLIVR